MFSNPPSDWAVVSLFWEGSSSDAVACPGWAKNATVAINAEKIPILNFLILNFCFLNRFFKLFLLDVDSLMLV